MTSALQLSDYQSAAAWNESCSPAEVIRVLNSKLTTLTTNVTDIGGIHVTNQKD